MNRVEELYEIIKNSQDELEYIRTNCKHENHFTGNYSWRPGAIQVGEICNYCGEFLGEWKTFKEWTDTIEATIQSWIGETEYCDGKIYIKRFYEKHKSKYEYTRGDISPRYRLQNKCTNAISDYEEIINNDPILKNKLDIINNPDKYNIFGDTKIFENQFKESIKQYL